MRAQKMVQCKLPKASGKCVDCDEPAVNYDHRDYTKPLEVDAVCSRCNTLRGQGYPALDGPDIEVSWITSKKDDVLENRFELRMTEQELLALNRLAHLKGRDRSKVVAGMIRNAAKRSGVWE